MRQKNAQGGSHEPGARELKLLRGELELQEMPETVAKRLEAVYAGLPEEMPRAGTGSHAARKTVIGVTAGAAAAFVMMFGLNAVNPVLAESIPLVGGIFRAVNASAHEPENIRETGERVQQLAEPVTDEALLTIDVPAAKEGEIPLTLSLRETYYDGTFVYAGLALNCDTDKNTLMDNGIPGYNIVIDGEEQRNYDEMGRFVGDKNNGFVDMTSYQWTKDESGSFVIRRAFRVPDSLRGKDELRIVLQYSGMTGGNSETIEEEEYEREINTSQFEISFTVKKNGAEVKTLTGNGQEMGGVNFVSAIASPAGVEVVLDCPEEIVNPAWFWQYADGRRFGGMGEAFPTQPENGKNRLTSVSGGVDVDELTPIVVFVYDKNGSKQVEAEFTLDFAAGTVEATRHFADPDDVLYRTEDGYQPNLQLQDYFCETEEIRSLTEGYLLSYLTVASDGMLSHVSILTPNEYRGAHLEVRLNGEIIDEVDSVDREEVGKAFFERDYSFNWPVQNPDGTMGNETIDSGLNAYQFTLSGNEASKGDVVTFRLTDSETGETLMEESITMKTLSEG